jgi:hypothetical protein
MLQVGRQARVTELNRPAPEDRSAHVGKQGLLVQRLNVPWDPDVGSLWKLRFEDGEEIVFSESELVMLGPDGRELPGTIEDLKEVWGVAPRVGSRPFKPFAGGVRAAPAVLALIVFCIAGVLLLWAGITTGTALLSLAGGALVLVGIGAAALLVT